MKMKENNVKRRYCLDIPGVRITADSNNKQQLLSLSAAEKERQKSPAILSIEDNHCYSSNRK